MGVEPKKLIAVFIAVGIALFLVIVVAMSFPKLSNAFSRTFSKPEDYYHKIELKTINALIDSMTDVYNEAVDFSSISISGKQEVTIGKTIANLIEDETGFDLRKLSSAGVEYTFSRNDKKDGLATAVWINKNQLLSMNLFLDEDEGFLYITIPELSDEAIEIEVPLEYVEVVEDFLDQIEDSRKSLPKSSSMNKLLKKYAKIAVESLNDVQKSRESLSAGDLEASYTTLTVTIGGDEIIDILENVLKELKKDKEVKALYTLFTELEADSRSYRSLPDYDEFLDDMEYLIDAIDNSSSLSDTIEMVVFVDGSGNIVGRELSFGGKSGGIKMKAAFVRKGTKVGIEAVCKQTSKTLLSFVGNGKISGTSLKADFILKLVGTKYADISIERLKLLKLKNGQLDMKILLKPSAVLSSYVADELYVDSTVSSLMKKLSLALDMKTNDKSVDTTIELFSSDNLLAGLSFESKTGKPGKINTVRSGAAPDEWIENLDSKKVDAFFLKLRKNDFPDELVDELEEFFEELTDW